MIARFTFNVALTIDGKEFYGRSSGTNEADAIVNALWLNPRATAARIVRIDAKTLRLEEKLGRVKV